MSEFKVGDRVVGNAKASKYSLTGPGWKGRVMGVHPGGVITVIGPGCPIFGFSVKACCFDRVAQKIVVTTDGVTTSARMFEGKDLVKSAEAKCSPRDTFDFETGAALALDRLLDRATKAGPEAPKFPRDKLLPGIFGRMSNGKWFVVVEDRMLYVEPGRALSGFDYVRDITAEGTIGDHGRAIDCLVEGLSFAHAAGVAHRGENIVWSREGVKF